MEGTSEPIYLEFADALELYAAIIGGTPAQAADQLSATRYHLLVLVDAHLLKRGDEGRFVLDP